jgi:dipeptidase E
MNILLCSNGKLTKEDNLLNYALDYLEQQIKDSNIKSYTLIPYAIIRSPYEQRVIDLEKTLKHLGIKVHNICDSIDPVKAIEKAEGIAVSGGNTWFLNYSLHINNLIGAIRKAVLKDNKPYVGWSAGTNIATPTILTTNDMPIISTLIAPSLNLVPFQINPHYIDSSIDGHMGETRDERIEEFLVKNQHQYVVGLREGSLLNIKNNNIQYFSAKNHKIKIFEHNKDSVEYDNTQDLSFLYNRSL